MDTHGIAIVAAGVVGFALASKRLEAGIITAPMAFTVFGLLIGNAALGVVDLDFGHGFVHGLAEVTLILVLFSDAARIDLRRLRRQHDLPVRMLVVGMPLTIVVGAVLALALPLGLSIWEAALLAAILAPTDAALGQAVVSNPLVPVRIRQALNVESGLNDGIALPLVLLFACLAGASHAVASGTDDWLLFGAKQIVLGPVAGAVVGGLGSWLLDRAATKEWISEGLKGPAMLGVALLAFAFAEIIGGNGIISAFVAGLVFGNRVRGHCGAVFEFAESEGQLLTLMTFLVFGATLLPDAIAHFDWIFVVYALMSLTIVRMAPVALSLTGSGVRPATTIFLGWFGPRGLASILFALLILEEVTIGGSQTIIAVTMLTVTLSIVLHGLSAAPGARWYGALARRIGDCEENKPVSEMPTRSGMVTPPARP